MKRFIALALMLLIWWPVTGFSREPVRVAVFPFSVSADRDLDYLRAEIPNIIQRHLAGTDVTVLPMTSPDEMTPAALGEAARAVNCAYVVWGTLSWTGDRFVLAAWLSEAEAQAPAMPLNAAGEGIENLPGAVQQISEALRRVLVPREIIADVRVAGNLRIEADAIKRIVTTKPGDDYLPRSLSRDLKAVYAMGYFDDIRIEADDSPGGKIVTFRVTEKPTVKAIAFKGNTAIATEALEKNIDIHTGAILNVFDIRENLQRLELQYQERNYHSARVTYETQPAGENQVILTFVVDEGEKIRIKEIEILGNEAFSDKQLRKVMKTSEKGMFSWLTSSGEYHPDMLKRDVAMLEAFYQNNGYVEVRVADPDVEQKDNWMYVTFKVDEGPRFKVGKVDVAGDLILPHDELMAVLDIAKEEYYNRDAVRKDVLTITDLYADYGYAFADVAPHMGRNPEENTVHITFRVDKGNAVYFEKIRIGGNTKTRDKVIRRELKVHEQDLFSGKDLKKSVKNLNRLNFFEDVKVNTYKGSSDDTMVLQLDVTEKPTGNFTFGGGYSSVEKVFLTTSISQNNFLGRGQALSLSTQLGATTSQLMAKFIEPWLFDIPLNAGFTVFKWGRDYDEYDKESLGGSISASYPFFAEDMRLFASYAYDMGELTDIEETASKNIKELEGTLITSSVSAGVSYDTRDKIVNPTSGQDHRFTVEYAGLGGDVGFTKLTGELGWYMPLFWKFVGFIHAEAGYIFENSSKKLPDYERFYMGGINSMRGFDWRDVHLWDDEGAEVGGNQMVQINLELLFPLVNAAGLMGVVFFDTGQVFDDDAYLDRVYDSDQAAYYGTNPADFDFGAFRQTMGFGFRWYSPMGPIRLEYGHVLDSKSSDESSGKWEFTMGAAF